MRTFYIHLRSGRVLKLRAKKFTVTVVNGHSTGYKFEGASGLGRKPFFLDPSEIVAVEQR